MAIEIPKAETVGQVGSAWFEIDEEAMAGVEEFVRSVILNNEEADWIIEKVYLFCGGNRAFQLSPLLARVDFIRHREEDTTVVYIPFQYTNGNSMILVTHKPDFDINQRLKEVVEDINEILPILYQNELPLPLLLNP